MFSNTHHQLGKTLPMEGMVLGSLNKRGSVGQFIYDFELVDKTNGKSIKCF